MSRAVHEATLVHGALVAPAGEGAEPHQETGCIRPAMGAQAMIAAGLQGTAVLADWNSLMV